MPPPGDLRSLALEELAELRDLFRVNWPKYAFTYNTLEVFFHWRNFVRNGEVQVFTDPAHDWRKTGTFVVKDHNELFFDTLDDTLDSLGRVLQTVMKDCETNISLVYDSCFRELIDSIISSVGYCKHVEERMVCYRQSVPSTDDICAVETHPDGYRFDSVRLADKTFVEKLWEHNDPLFANLPSRLIDRNPSLGVYDAHDRLVSWCLIDQTGALAVFQTIPSHRKKGLGQAIIRKLANQLHAAGKLPQAFVVEANVPSRNLFEKLGFDAVELWYWTKLKKLEH